LKTNYQILIIFGTNIFDTTCHQTTIHFPTSPTFVSALQTAARALSTPVMGLQ